MKKNETKKAKTTASKPLAKTVAKASPAKPAVKAAAAKKAAPPKKAPAPVKAVAAKKAEPAKKTSVKAVAAKKAAPAKKAPVKAVAAKKAAPPKKAPVKAVAAKKAEPPKKAPVKAEAKKAAPAKKAAVKPVAKKAAPPKKAPAPVKAVAAKKAEPAKKTVAKVEAKKVASAKQAAPVKKTVAKVEAKKAAPAKKAPVKPASQPASASKKKTDKNKEMQASHHGRIITKAELKAFQNLAEANGHVIKKSYLSPKMKKHYREMLLKLRESHQDQLNIHRDDALTNRKSGPSAGMATHMADLGSDNFQHDFELGLLSDEGTVIEMIDEALTRLDENEYGICIECGQEISPARLEVKPYARFCLECKSRKEAHEGMRRR